MLKSEYVSVMKELIASKGHSKEETEAIVKSILEAGMELELAVALMSDARIECFFAEGEVYFGLADEDEKGFH